MMHNIANPRLCAATFIFALCVFAHACQAAPPVLNYLDPAGAQRGTTVAVTASGTFGNWPVEVWTGRDGISVEVGQDKGKLNVNVAADAQGGVYWLRLYDAEGATVVRPFIVGTLPEVIEAEPNDELSKPQTLDESAVVNGKLAKAGDVDGYAIKLRQGQTVVASLCANELLGSPMDAVLQLCTQDGFVLAQNDDARGIDPQIAFEVPADGTYLVRAFAFPVTANSTIGFAGADNFVYRLTITTGGFVDHSIPLAARRAETTEVALHGWNVPSELAHLPVAASDQPNDVTLFHPQLSNTLQLPVIDSQLVVADETSDAETPQAISLPATITGRIGEPRDVDAFRFAATKGQRLSFQVASRGLGYSLDAVLRITDAVGKQLAEADDNKQDADPVLAYSIPADGEYTLEIRDLYHHGGFRYVYRLTAEIAQPDFQLTIAADSFVLTPGKPLEIPITIQRDNGFAEEIEIQTENLPDGVSAAPIKSLAKGDTAKSVKLILTADKGPSRGAIRIFGKSAGDNAMSRSARYSVAGLSIGRDDLWLTVLTPAVEADDKSP